MAGWELWERALVPSLLSGAGTWTGDLKEVVEQCDKIQNYFWRIILGVPESCPKVALRCETKQMGMKWRIWQEKVFLLQRIINLDDDTLAKQVYQEGKDHDWPGLWKDVSDICKELVIPDVSVASNDVSRETIKKAIFEHHYEDMIKDIHKKIKLEDIKHESFNEPQSYMSNKSIAWHSEFGQRC